MPYTAESRSHKKIGGLTQNCEEKGMLNLGDDTMLQGSSQTQLKIITELSKSKKTPARDQLDAKD